MKICVILIMLYFSETHFKYLPMLYLNVWAWLQLICTSSNLVLLYREKSGTQTNMTIPLVVVIPNLLSLMSIVRQKCHGQRKKDVKS